MSIYAIIPAAGQSLRMGEVSKSCSKVLLPAANGKPLLYYTVQALVATELFAGIVVAARPDDTSSISALLEEFCSKLRIIVVSGGDTRQQSVFRAICAAEGLATHLLIHDGARPLCPGECIVEIAEVTKKYAAALLATPVTSTLKRVESGKIQATVPREALWAAQTPQGFSYEIIRRAHEQALADGFVGTDDCQLVERIGVEIRVVRGSERNVKITSPEDYELASLLISTGQ